MKKKLLIVLCLVLAITLTGCGKKSAKIEEKEEKTEKREGNASDDNYVISYKDSDALDQIPTKEVDGINYKSFSVKNGDALDVYTIAYNDSDNKLAYSIRVNGQKDDSVQKAFNHGFFTPHSAYIVGNHFDDAESYTMDRIFTFDVPVVIDDNTLEYDSYKLEKKTLNLYFKFNGETEVEAKVYIIGLKDGKIIGCGETDVKKIDEDGVIEKDAVIKNKGDKGVASFQNIKLNFDLEDSDQILYFVGGRFIVE